VRGQAFRMREPPGRSLKDHRARAEHSRRLPLGRSVTRKADESIAAPKEHGPPDSAAFHLQIGIFVGTTTGTTMAIADPWPRLAPP
jgi:hypothetical protein